MRGAILAVVFLTFVSLMIFAAIDLDKYDKATTAILGAFLMGLMGVIAIGMVVLS